MNLRSRIQFCLVVIGALALISFPGTIFGTDFNPRIVGSVDTPGSACDVYVSGGYAYVADNYSLPVIDVSNPTSPYIVGSVDTPSYCFGVQVSGQYAYVADCHWLLQVIDVSNPASPVSVGLLDTPGYACRVHVSDRYVYVADAQYGLHVVDVSNPASPVIVGSVATPGGPSYAAEDVDVSGGYAYVADAYSGLQVIDVSNPVNPHIVGSVDTPGRCGGVRVSGNYAYVADGRSGFLVIDVSNPASPRIVGSVGTQDFAEEVFISGGYAYVADSYSGLQVIDVSSPQSPVIVATVDTPGIAYGVYVSGGYAYVADRASGLQIIDLFYEEVVTQPPIMGDVPDQDATVGAPFSLDLSAYVTQTDENEIVEYELTGTLPDGLSFDYTTSLLTGTPESGSEGSYALSARARDIDGWSNEDDFTINVASQGTIVIDGCDTGVEDQLYEGQWISEMIDACAASATNHGEFVSCVADLTNELKRAGVITGAEKGAIQSCAAQADIP